MIKIENVDVVGWEHAIRGMRNPKNSWDKSDSTYDAVMDEITDDCIGFDYHVGPNDHDLMMRLANGGPVHAKYRRMITVYLDITAPLYWWKEFDTYKVGTVANSCSTMHKIHEKEFTLEDFSHEHLMGFDEVYYNGDAVLHCEDCDTYTSPEGVLETIVDALNIYRNRYLLTKDKKYWWQMIQLLPSSYNQKRTVMLNYEVLTAMYESRRHHKLDEWHTLCDWIESLPYSEIITGEKLEEK